MRINLAVLAIVVIFSYLVPFAAVAQSSAFSYQGRLNENSMPASGTFDFTFKLFDALNGGNMMGGVEEIADLPVADGYFTVMLDFGAIFDGTPVWLEIGVREGASAGAYTTLQPRQLLTAAPTALFALGVAEHDHGGPGLEVVTAFTEGDPNTQPRQLMATAVCPSGKVAFGGGATIAVVGAPASALDSLALFTSRPTDCEGVPLLCSSWVAVATEVNSVTGTWRVTASAVCGNP